MRRSSDAWGRAVALTAAAVLVPVTFGLKYYRGPGQWWVNNWGSSAGYEWFFIALVLAVRPRRTAVVKACVGVCGMTVALEFLQLWTPPWLQAVRGTFLGRGLLGNSFDWWDLPAYPLACGVAMVVLLWVWPTPANGQTVVREA